ncbi:MAG TPA: ligase-associated DNA damage response endonuclease PdeM [Novosphingobium sp.]|nr:ligase-associated DNA damage response endonuclease PdeM [Novosphingobium sp.]
MVRVSFAKSRVAGPQPVAPVSFAGPFAFAGHEWRISESRAVYWPAESALLVADLHLEKASWFATRGAMLPPYDSRETLERLQAAASAAGARRIYCLGDSFHDAAGPERIEPQARAVLAQLARAHDLVWIAGNHDAGVSDGLPGTIVPELLVAGIALRHEAEPATRTPEISGHFHPKLRISVRGRHISRPCALVAGERMILPAFGTLTGGLEADAPPILAALRPARAVDAVLAAGGRALRFPVWRG